MSFYFPSLFLSPWKQRWAGRRHRNTGGQIEEAPLGVDECGGACEDASVRSTTR